VNARCIAHRLKAREHRSCPLESRKALEMPHNKQLQRTVMPRHVRATSAPFHYALAARMTRYRAAAELRRYAARTAQRAVRGATSRETARRFQRAKT
jgi:hypothetical protein